jgi:hypothetical protein
MEPGIDPHRQEGDIAPVAYIIRSFDCDVAAVYWNHQRIGFVGSDVCQMIS